MNAEEFLKEFHDYLAPILDTYEQAIYLYTIRHSRLIDKKDAVIGFKSARKKFAFGIGKKGTPLSEGVCYEKLRSLEGKGCLEIVGTERNGTRVRSHLPKEIPNLIPEIPEPKEIKLEDMDFFNVPENRELILRRENNKCFYCLRKINVDNYVIEHVLSRPEGDHSYMNVVAACRQCNNRKGQIPADDFMRILYRDGYLNSTEFDNCLSHLERLISGELKPPLRGG